MTERVQFLVCVTLKNVISVISFCVLAYLFQHWWISLFSLLFMSSFSYYPVSTATDTSETPKTSEDDESITNVIQCCVCGEYLFVNDIENAVHIDMKDKGWRRIQVAGHWSDICPICAEEYYNKKR